MGRWDALFSFLKARVRVFHYSLTLLASIMEPVRRIIFYKHYFKEFFDAQSDKVQDKIDQVLFVVSVSERIPQKFFKHMEGTDGLYEIRVEYQGNIFRVFCCFDEGKLVILFNGFQKKGQKTPRNELDRALMLKGEYFSRKNQKEKP